MARAYRRSPVTYPKYSDPEEVRVLVENYFKDCEGRPLKDDAGNLIYDKYGLPIVIDRRPPTTAGLARALGFTSRQSLLNYKAKKEFKAIFEDARMRIEQYTEERLFDRDGNAGAKFSLQNNFEGWNNADLKKAEASAPSVKIVCDIPKGRVDAEVTVPEAPENEVIEEDDIE